MENFDYTLLKAILSGHYDPKDPEGTLPRSGSSAPLIRIPRSGTILQQGDPADTIYFLLSGLAAVINSNEITTSNTLDTVEPPHILGLIERLTGGSRYTAYAIAETDCVLYKMRTKDFLAAIQTHAELCYHTLEIMSQITVHNMELAETHRTFRSRDILGYYLYVQASKGRPYQCPLTRNDLSKELNINLRSLFRYLDHMKAAGYVDIVHGKIRIQESHYEKLTSRYGDVVM